MVLLQVSPFYRWGNEGSECSHSREATGSISGCQWAGWEEGLAKGQLEAVGEAMELLCLLTAGGVPQLYAFIKTGRTEPQKE